MFSSRQHGWAMAACGVLLAVSAAAQQGVDTSVHSFSPERIPFSEAMMQQLKLPQGFSINVFARDVTDGRMLEVDEDGTVYVTQPDEGQVLALKDTNGDGTADQRSAVVSGLGAVHGIRLHQGKLYLATPTTVWVAERGQDGKFGKPRELLANMPSTRSHSNRTIGFGPDGKMYVSIGSSCNICVERNPELATIIRANLDGSGREVFARGLRNTIGFGWHPQTKQMWGMDHGSDMIGNDLPPEELNLLQQGKDYGWPYCYADRKVHPKMSEPPSGSKEQYCPTTEPVALGFQAHSSPIGMVFYTGQQFPAEYRNDAFVAFRGSWNRKPASGYRVMRVKFENGKPVRFEDFVTGFLVNNGSAVFGRPTGVAVAKDGALLFADDTSGVVYRVSYAAGSGATTKRKSATEKKQ